VLSSKTRKDYSTIGSLSGGAERGGATGIWWSGGDSSVVCRYGTCPGGFLSQHEPSSIACQSIKLTHRGSADPDRTQFPHEIIKGDFRTVGFQGTPFVGDAEEDQTYWICDFSEYDFWRETRRGVKIRQAEMVWSLKATGSACNDTLDFGGLLARNRFPEVFVTNGQLFQTFRDVKIVIEGENNLAELRGEIRSHDGKLPILHSDGATIFDATWKICVSK
jgi:hypothetical protein